MSMNDMRGVWRGKLVNNGEWFKGYLYGKKDGVWYLCDCFGEKYEIDPKTLGECTCLQDKNGTPIFEGDIVEYKGKRHVIKYLEKYMRFSPVKPSTVFAVFDYTQSEVIGNIHDTPELLKGVDDDGQD